MPKYRVYTQQEVIEKTSEIVHLFYRRNIRPMAKILADNFVWIGAFEFQYIQGKNEFLKSITAESQEMPVNVSQEEFALLTHDHNLWVVYGRYIATAVQEDNTLILAKTRNTFVWQQVQDELVLLEIHGSHARDVPLEFTGNLPPSVVDNEAWFDYIKGIDRVVGPPKKIIFKDDTGNYRFVLPSEILYVKAEDKQCLVYTGNDCFTTRVSLKSLAEKSPLFLLCHRSYIVNIHSVKSIKRYELKLINGEFIPVSKERFMTVKNKIHEFSK